MSALPRTIDGDIADPGSQRHLDLTSANRGVHFGFRGPSLEPNPVPLFLEVSSSLFPAIFSIGIRIRYASLLRDGRP